MRAAVMRANNAPLEIEDVQIDGPGPGEVLVKTAASGICHSDLTVIEGGLPLPPPCVLGHEPAGVVEAIGSGVTHVSPGDHVIGCLSAWCGVCTFCTGGRPYMCPTQFDGRPPDAKPRLAAANGEPLYQFANLSSFAERMLCPERSMVKIRNDMPLPRSDGVRGHGSGGVPSAWAGHPCWPGDSATSCPFRRRTRGTWPPACCSSSWRRSPPGALRAGRRVSPVPNAGSRHSRTVGPGSSPGRP